MKASHRASTNQAILDVHPCGSGPYCSMLLHPCMLLSLHSSLWNCIASIQSSVASRCASGHSPGSPLKMGGGILTQGLELSSSPESESTLSSVSLPPKDLAIHFLFLECQEPPYMKASHRASTNQSILDVHACGSGSYCSMLLHPCMLLLAPSFPTFPLGVPSLSPCLSIFD